MRLDELVRRCLATPSPRRKGAAIETDVPLHEIARYLPADPVIVEAGAHVGRDTVRFADAWPQGVVHAFEPVPELYRRVEEATRELPNVRSYPVALGSRDGSAIFHVSGSEVMLPIESDASSSLLVPSGHLERHPMIHFERELEVETITLDSWKRRGRVERVDFLWLDLQGYEPQVLEAAPETLAGVSAIHTEVSLLEMYEGSWLYPRFRKWLEDRGFTVAAERLPFPGMGNVLFVRSCPSDLS